MVDLTAYSKYRLTTDQYLWALVYFVISVLLHWRLHLDWDIVWYFAGGLIGIHLLDLLDRVLKSTALTSVFAQCILLIVTFFVLTSTNSLLGKGIVLFVNLHYVYLQYGEYQKTHLISSWMQKGISLNPQQQGYYVYWMWVVFALCTLLFALI